MYCNVETCTICFQVALFITLISARDSMMRPMRRDALEDIDKELPQQTKQICKQRQTATTSTLSYSVESSSISTRASARKRVLM